MSASAPRRSRSNRSACSPGVGARETGVLAIGITIDAAPSSKRDSFVLAPERKSLVANHGLEPRHQLRFRNLRCLGQNDLYPALIGVLSVFDRGSVATRVRMT